MKIVKYLFLSVIVLSLMACSHSSIDQAHPMIKPDSGPLVASVYFLRPLTERFLGVADNALIVELDRQKVMDMAKGEYTLLHLVPGKVWVTTKSKTSWGPNNAIKETSRSREFEFLPGRTYFIVLDVIDGEFRGVAYVPKLLNLSSARVMARDLRPFGSARGAPI